METSAWSGPSKYLDRFKKNLANKSRAVLTVQKRRRIDCHVASWHFSDLMLALADVRSSGVKRTWLNNASRIAFDSQRTSDRFGRRPASHVPRNHPH
jgi:hypothetical protein